MDKIPAPADLAVGVSPELNLPDKKIKKKKNRKSKKRIVNISPSAEIARASGSPNPDPFDYKSSSYQGTGELASNEVKVTVTDFFNYQVAEPANPPAVNSVLIYYLDTEQQFFNTDTNTVVTNSYKPAMRVTEVMLYSLPLTSIGSSIADSIYVVKSMVPSSQNESNNLVIGLNTEAKEVLADYQQKWVKVAHYKVNTLFKSAQFSPYIKNASDQALIQFQVVNPDSDTPFTGRAIQFKIVIKAAVIINPSQSIKFALKGENNFSDPGTVVSTLGPAYVQINGMSKQF